MSCDIRLNMISQYPLRIKETIWRKAKAKAALDKITLRKVIEELLEGWIDGKIMIQGDNGNNPIEVADGRA